MKAKMQIISLNVGMPRTILDGSGKPVETGIFKQPVKGRRAVVQHQIEGDGQADLRVHGGPDKAVYGYPVEHYAAWHAERNLPLDQYGLYGENLTTSGMLEEDVCIGDQYRAGTALLEVTQPRMPCFKLGLRVDQKEFPKRFHQSGRSGFYFRVLEPGALAGGDSIVRTKRDPAGISIHESLRLAFDKGADPDRIQTALNHPAVSEAWKAMLLRPARD